MNQALRRRSLLAWPAGLLLPPALARGVGPDGEANLARVALSKLRLTDANPSWMTSENWGNRAYGPWTDYLAGRMSESEFATVCANPSDYCLRDIWNLRKRKPDPIDWSRQQRFDWNAIHALGLRFFRSGDPIYLTKWFDVVADYARWTESSPPNDALVRGEPGALLGAAFAWGGILIALAVIAKGMGTTTRSAAQAKASPFDGNPDPLAAEDLADVPVADLLRIANAFARGPAPLLARHYANPKYVPNQRCFGFEALALLDTAFGALPTVATLRPAVNAGLQDVFSRYRQRDGGQLEQSFNYAQDLVAAATRCVQLPTSDGTATAWRAEARETRIGWWRMAAALATPEGGLPQLGNAVWGRFGRFRKDEVLPRFGVPSIALPYSGLYAMRSGDAPDAAYLFFFARRAARGHTMAGGNSIQVAAYGRQLVGAGGSANYSGRVAAGAGALAYLSEASSHKTSTVLVDDRWQRSGSMQGLPTDAQGRPDITRAPSVPVASRWLHSRRFDYVEGLHTEGYQGGLGDGLSSAVTDVSHWRRVVFVRELVLWLVVDVLRSPGQHRYTQVWNFAAPGNGLAVPGFRRDQVELNEGARRVRTTDAAPGAVNLSLLHFGVPGPTYQRFFGEASRGYFSRGPLTEPTPAADVHASWSGRGPQVLLTLIVPHRGSAPEIETARDLSGAGTADLELTMRNGQRLAVQAGAATGALQAGPQRAAAADLVLWLDIPQRPAAGVVIGPDGSHAFDGDRRSPITVPAGLRWDADAAGVLTPVYGT